MLLNFQLTVFHVIRYLHYALNCIGTPPNWITFIRYNAFVVLYPIGVFPGEMCLMFQALPTIKKEHLYADSLPFSYEKFIKRFAFLLSVFVDETVPSLIPATAIKAR
ncbi:hypothetical protein OROGR_024541 [Orobanche gracilis]